ncbi:Tetraspanin 66E [Carabus blaptoides fortunei]
MAVDCGALFAKYLLCLFNFVFFLTGTAVLSIGIWLAVDKNSFIALTKMVAVEQLQQFSQPAVIEQASYILIAAGAFMFVVSFLGYCGALKESQCLLTAYGVCLVVILIMEIVAGGLAAAYRGKAQEETRTFLKSTISKYYAANKTDAVTLMWNHLMSQMSCCGVDDYTDFKASPKWVTGNKTVPDACCMLTGDVSLFNVRDKDCPYSPNDTNSYYKKGCYDVFMEWILSHTDIVIGIGIGLGLIQLLGIFLAFCLCKSIDGYVK